MDRVEVKSRRAIGVNWTAMYPIDRSTAIQRLASQFGVEVWVVAKEGEPYIAKTQIMVPPGHEYLRFRSESWNLSDFWQGVDDMAERLSSERLMRE